MFIYSVIHSVSIFGHSVPIPMCINSLFPLLINTPNRVNLIDDLGSLIDTRSSIDFVSMRRL